MNNFENAVGMEDQPSFRDLVGALVEQSPVFPLKMVGDHEMSILDAIENYNVRNYLSTDSTEQQASAVHALVEIFDELQEENPNQDIIATALVKLNEYL